VKRKSIHLAHLHVARANSVGEQLGVGSGVATQMRALAIVMLVSGAVVAEPRVALVEDAGFVWRAPDACPDAANVKSRAERRLGAALDGNLHGIEIEITRERGGFVASIDARAITVANDVRTLRSRRCDALADAVAVVLARLASEVRMSRRHAPIASDASIDSTIAMVAPATTTAALDSEEDPEGDMSSQRIVDEEPATKRARRWGGGLHVLALSGVGALPQINLGGEISAFVRREDKFAALGVSRWVPQNAKLAPGAPGGVDVRLDTFTLRGGWGPSNLPIRAWLLGEAGRLQGTGIGVDDERTAGAPWFALGAGLGVGWPMSDHARLVGTFEIAVPVQRPRFMLAQGSDLYQPGALAARCALGLEVGWP
jgi:hypothetical protein